MPKERIVRSTGTPAASTATPSERHPAERHVRGAGAVAAQDDLVEGIATPSRARGRRRCRRGAWRWRRSVPTPCPVHRPATPAARRPRPSPPPRSAADVGGPATSTSSTTSSGQTLAMASAMPGVRTTRTDPGAVGPHARADRWAFRPEADDVLPAVQHADRPPVAVGQTPGDVGDLARHLAAEGTAVGQRRHRITARLAPRCVGLEVAGFDPRRLQRAVPVARWHVDRPRQRRCRAPSLHLAGHPPRLAERLADVPLPVGAASSDQCILGRRVVGEPGPAECHMGADRLGAAALQPRPLARPVLSDVAESGEIRRTERCRRSVRHPVHRHRWAARARCTASTDVRSSIAATRTMIPGVQNPHCDAPLAVNASAHATASGSPSTVVTSRPATRPTGVTHETRGLPSTSTVQHPHCPCGLHPSLAERAPRRSRRTSRRETSVSAISTGRPSRRKEIRRSSDHSRRCGWRWGW